MLINSKNNSLFKNNKQPKGLIMISKLKNYLVIIIFSVISINSASAIELKKKLPKIGGSSSGGVNLDEAKTKFTKIFFESTLNYMEAQYHLFNALEKNDRAGKTRKAIDFVKNDKNKEGKRLTNAFNIYFPTKPVPPNTATFIHYPLIDF